MNRLPGGIVSAEALMASTRPKAGNPLYPKWDPEGPLQLEEWRILDSLSTGLTQKQVARRLGVEYETLKHVVARILRRLDANGMAHCVAEAIRRDIIDPADVAGTPFVILGTQERATLNMISTGHKGREIAVKLGVPYNYSKNIRTRLIRQLGATNAPHAISIGMGKGIIR